MNTNNLHNRTEKIKFLNNLKNGISIVDEILYPECEIWKKDSTGYSAVLFSENSRKDLVHISIDEMEKKMKAKNKTLITTHDQQTVLIF